MKQRKGNAASRAAEAEVEAMFKATARTNRALGLCPDCGAHVAGGEPHDAQCEEGKVAS